VYLFFLPNLLMLLLMFHLQRLGAQDAIKFRNMPEPVRFLGCVKDVEELGRHTEPEPVQVPRQGHAAAEPVGVAFGVAKLASSAAVRQTIALFVSTYLDLIFLRSKIL